MNSITELLNLEDADIFISNISINGTKKILTLETKPIRHFCPVCGFKMYSRVIKVRTINHPVLQDGFKTKATPLALYKHTLFLHNQ